jgi:hypothetical protein
MKALLTEDLWEAVRIWKDYRRYGLPNGKGMLEESYETISLITAFEEEFNNAVSANQDKE